MLKMHKETYDIKFTADNVNQPNIFVVENIKPRKYNF